PAPATGLRRADPWQRPPMRTVLAALWTVLALFVALAVLLYVAGTRPSAPATAPGQPTAPSQRLLVVEVNLAKADFPAGWKVDASATGPLTGLLAAGAGTGAAPVQALTPADSRQEARVGRQFSRCLGIAPAKDRVFGKAGAGPVARGSSPAFEAPAGGPPLEGGSVTAVYRSGVPVSAAMAQVLEPRFADCFGRAVASQVRAASAASAAGAAGVGVGAATTYGTPTAHPLALAHHAGVRAAGVDLDFPVTVGGSVTGVQLGFVFVGGGRVASTLVTFGTSTGFPATLTSRLTQAVERRVAAHQ
ncbi:MAG: hypothetical protein ACRDYZ_13940, partial [Acidimicrobiales bacterium]